MIKRKKLIILFSSITCLVIFTSVVSASYNSRENNQRATSTNLDKTISEQNHDELRLKAEKLFESSPSRFNQNEINRPYEAAIRKNLESIRRK